LRKNSKPRPNGSPWEKPRIGPTLLRHPLHEESGHKKLEANFEHFGLVVWPQDTNKRQNIDIGILINAGILAPRVANWLPKLDGT